MEMQTRWERTVTEVYGVPSHTICAPDGHELTGEFRPPRQHETWLASCQKDVGIGLCCDCRLILRPKPKMRTVTIEVPENEMVVAYVTEPPREIREAEPFLFGDRLEYGDRNPVAHCRPLRRLDVR